MRKTSNIILSLITVIIVLTACINNPEKEHQGTINLEHLKHLYAAVTIENGKEAGVINIYSEYPDYDFEIEPKEGFTCVDDVARAMMIDAIRFSNEKELQTKYDFLAEFILYMQAENGYFHNFIWNDLSINKTYRTSLAEPNWWSWRAFWALSNYKSKNEDLMKKSAIACERLAENIFKEYLDKPKSFDTINGVMVPNWLPNGIAGDQAAILILGLEAYYQQVKKDERALQVIERMADGLIETQKGDANIFPFGAYLSWQNMWHAYGNSQAYAMLKAGQLLDRKDYIESALLEINHFYPYLMKKNFPAYFSIKKADGRFEIIDQQQFPQIAYGFRPMIWACVEAFTVSDKEKHLRRAEEITAWFYGENIANQQMYDPARGRCYDGIISETKVNRNSGAESTIEALLSLQAFDQIKHR